MDNTNQKITNETPEPGYAEWAYELANSALGAVSTFVGFSNSTTPKTTTNIDETNNNPGACQTTGKPVCCCSKNKPK